MILETPRQVYVLLTGQVRDPGLLSIWLERLRRLADARAIAGVVWATWPEERDLLEGAQRSALAALAVEVVPVDRPLVNPYGNGFLQTVQVRAGLRALPSEALVIRSRPDVDMPDQLLQFVVENLPDWRLGRNGARLGLFTHRLWSSWFGHSLAFDDLMFAGARDDLVRLFDVRDPATDAVVSRLDFEHLHQFGRLPVASAPGLTMWRELFHEFRLRPHLGAFGSAAEAIRRPFAMLHHDWFWEAWSRQAGLADSAFFCAGLAFHLAMIDELFVLDRPEGVAAPRLARPGVRGAWEREGLTDIPSDVDHLVRGPLLGTARTLDAVWRDPAVDASLQSLRALDPRPSWIMSELSRAEARQLAWRVVLLQAQMVAELAPRAVRVSLGAQRRRLATVSETPG